jgi:NAD(P)-dependent dehydrogenase (short-subunit alcohol dehydrogenase family)
MIAGVANGPLSGRSALVTGGARGIGAAIAEDLAARGASVTVADRDGAVAMETAAALALRGLAVQARACDLTVAAEVEALVEGLPVLDILVNNAAILDATPIGLLSRATYEQVQQINQNAALWVAQAVLPQLRASGRGRIVNVASIMGLRGSADSLAYSTAKGGLVNMTRALAVDLAPDGILVNCICPGFVDTRMAILPDGSGHEHETEWFQDIYIKYGRVPLRRVAPPAEIARSVAFFCGDDCSYVTGQILVVDGGLSATF